MEHKKSPRIQFLVFDDDESLVCIYISHYEKYPKMRAKQKSSCFLLCVLI